jgi:transposase InsO family protein
MAIRGPHFQRLVRWARQGLSGWRKAREAAIELYERWGSFARVAQMGNTSRQWVHQWWTRYQDADEDPAALESRSSRPDTIHRERDAYEEQILEAKDRYPMHGPRKLKHLADIPLSPVTIWKVLREHGRVNESPRRQGRRSYTRYQRSEPNDLWQVDIMTHRLEGGDGARRWIVTVLDDHSRFVVASSVLSEAPHEADMVRILRAAFRQWGTPEQVLTDRGHPFHSPDGVPRILSQWLEARGVRHIKASPGHPETLGKQERWHGSIQREWIDWTDPVSSAEGLQEQVHDWVHHYNTVRPHEALEMVPPVRVYTEGYFPEHGLARFVNEVR